MSYLLDTCILSKLREITKKPDIQLEYASPVALFA
jgi:hypothetical protein